MKTGFAKFLFRGALLVASYLVSAKPAQGQCTGGTPAFTVDLTGHPDSMWISTPVQRAGLCCGATNPDRCIQFKITLDPGSNGIILDIYSGARPSGALYYSIGCAGAYAVGQPICLTGVGPFNVTFCKPGNNINQYYIKAIPKPRISPNVVVSQACTKKIFMVGLVKDSITWQSVPSNPIWESYLSCKKACDTVTVTPTGAFPNYVTYKGCGTVIGGCSSSKFCDTVRVTFVNDLDVNILPKNPYICFGSNSAKLTAYGSGGLRPYKFLWSNGSTDSSITVGAGTYIVAMTDSLKCKTVYDTVVVGSYTMAIKAFPGNDTSLCSKINFIKLNGRVQSSTGGKWLGNGTFTPNNTTLTATYTFTAAEKSLGYADIKLATTGNNGCPPDTGKMRVTFLPTPVPIITGPDSPCQYKQYTYSVPSLIGASYSWMVLGGAIQGSSTNNSIVVKWTTTGVGIINVRETSSNGCDSMVTKTVWIMPTPTPVISGPDSTCSNRAYLYSVTPVAGTTYKWTATGGVISGSSTSTSVKILWGAAGTGKVTIKQTSSFGCDSTVSKTVVIMPTPAPVIVGPDSICSNRTSIYSITGAAGSSYFWSATGGTISGSKNSTSIKVLWGPSGTGKVTVTQTSNFDCDSTVSKTVKIMPTPAPVISGPDSTCSNKAYTYSITAIAGSTYNWTVTGGAISGSNTTNSIKVLWGATGTGKVTVKQTSSFGCDSTISKTVKIMPTPAPVISGPDSTCSNKAYTYSITAIAGSTYKWTVTGGAISGSSTSNTVKVLWGATGTGTVTVKQISSFGCDSTISKTVKIMPTPAPVISGPDSTCSNKAYTYSITAIAGSTYKWTVLGGAISGSSTSNTVKVLWGATGTGTVTVKQVSSFGCDSTISKTVKIMPTPAPVISGPDSTCSNKAYTYSITAIAGSTYKWTVLGGAISGSSTSNTVKVLWGATGTGTVTIKQVSSFGCDSTISKTVKIMPTPAPVISGPDSTCSNKAYTYSIAAIAGSTYKWTVTGGAISGSSTSNTVKVLWGAMGTGTVTVKQVSSFGCDSTISKTVKIMPTPAPVISGPDSTCSNKAYTYSITAIAGSTYNWTVVGGTISGSSTTNTVKVLWGATGTGTVTIKQVSSFGCDSTISKTVKIMPTPAPVISGPDSTCSNKAYTYSIIAIAGSTYKWTVTGGAISGSSTSNTVKVLWGATGTGTVTIKQVSSFGCDSTISKTVKIMPTPAPVISGPDSTCSNKAYTYSITAIAGSTYQWTVTGGFISGSSTANTVKVLWGAAGTGKVTVKQVSSFGCDSTISKNVKIMPTPAPVISGPDSTCSNKAYTYSITAIAGSTYNWTVVGGAISGSSASNSIKVLWGAAGAGKVTVKQTSSFGCDSTISKNITIVPTPAPVISGPDSTCSNKAYTYSITAIAGSTYKWTVLGGAISGSSTTNTVKVLWGATGTGTVTIKQVSSFGCDSTISKTVKIMPTPAPVISGPDSTCSNKAYTYSITAIAGSTYNWTVVGGTISGSSTTNTVKVLWGATGTGTVTIKQVSSFGCDSTISKNVKIMPTPAPVISGPDSTCSNKSYTYSITAIAGSTYKWTVLGGAISGSSTSNTVKVLWGATGTGTVTVKQVSGFGCDSTISKTVKIMPTPAPVISGSDSTCSNKAYTYSITAIAGSTYQWTVTGGFISGSSTANTVKVLWGAAGTGKVTVKQVSSFGCDSTISKTVKIMPTPAPVISGPDSTCSNKAYTYSITAIAGSTYNWTVVGGAISGSSTSNSIKVLWGAAGAGKVTVKQVSSFGCDSTISKTVTITPTPAPVISGPVFTCSNKIYAYSVSAVAGSSYAWSVTGGSILGVANSNSVNVRWGATGTGSLTVTQTSSRGCDSTISKTISISPSPTPVISGPNPACSNKTYYYSVPLISNVTFSWSVTGGTINGSTTGNGVYVLWGASGTGKISVTEISNAGCDSTISQNVTITATPAPVISGPDSTCSNKAYTYSITAIAGSTYQWVVLGGFISGSSTNNTVKVLWGAAGAGKVTVKQISSFGCDSTISKNIIIVPTPAPVISGPDSTCSNKAYTYSITAIAGSTYKWTVLGGAISGSSTNNTVKVLWGATGTGTVTVKQVSSFGCDSTISKAVKIMPTPAPVISGPDSTCSNKAYTYSITAIAGSTYNWTVVGGAISGSSTSNSIKVLWGVAGAGKVTVKQTSSFGCDSTISKNITIVPTPAPVISGPDSTCSNKAYTYSIAAIAGSTYKWTVAGGAISGSSTSNTVKVLWGATGTGTVTVKQISSFGCDSTISKTVKIMPTPAPVISGPDSTCSNKAYTYSITAIAGSTYNWSVTGGAISGSNTSNTIKVLWGATGTGTLTVKQISSFGCDSTISKTVKIMPTPAPVISGPDSTCSNKAYTYSITAIAGSTYKWTVTGGTISGSSTSNTVKVLWGATGTGTVTIKQTSSFGCDSAISKNVKIMPTPAPMISGPDSTCSNKAYTYSITAIAGSTYKWTVLGGAISGSSTNNTVKVLWGATGTGTVTVKQTSSFGCDSTISKAVKIMPTPAPVISGPDSTCSNKAYTYSITAIAGSTYNWTVVGGAISGSSTSNSIKVLWGATGAGKVTVKQVSNFGCDSAISKNIIIVPTPAPVISGPDSTCSNKAYIYSIVAIAGSTYKWTVLGGFISGSSTNNTVKVLWGATGTGTVTVKQISSFGCDSTISKTVKIMPTPAPVISGPSSTCSNKAYTYSITAIAGSTYKWTVLGGAISGSSTNNTVKVLWGATGTGTVTVKQTSSFGCDSSISATITIMPTPAPVISGPDSTCSNKAYTYSITAIAGSTYNWTVTGGAISGSSTNNTVKVLWGAAGAGKVTVKQISSFGCDSTISKNITIVPTPAPVISGPDSTCSNKAYTYSITAIAGSTYKWTVLGGAISGPSTNNTVKVLWGATGTGTVTVKQVSSFGCDSTISKNVKIMPTPAPVISGPDSTCSNKAYTYSITAIAGSTYNWTVVGGAISGSSTSNTVKVLWGVAGAGKVTVKQVSSFGCDSTISKNIIIVPTPAPVISGPDSTCSNKAYTYSITAIAGSTYKWTVLGGAISGSSTNNTVKVLWGAAGTGTVTIKQVSSFGCDSTISKTVRIMPTPAPVISGPSSTCSNKAYTYSITAIAGSTYNWTVTGGAISGSSTNNTVKVLWGASGTGTVTVKQTSSFGCDSSISATITIIPTPAPVISGPDSTCSNKAYTYSITAIAGSTYNWTVTGGAISGSSTNNTVKVLWGAAGAGKVTVKQISSFGCDSTISKNITIVPTPAPVISGPDSTCSNKAYTYSITAIAGSTYKWTVLGGAISGSSTNNTVKVLWGATGTGTVTVKQVSSFGCDSTISKNVKIMPTPAPVISGPDSTCSNKAYTYSITAIAGSTYNWTVVGGAISGSSTNNSIKVLWGAAGAGKVTVKQTSSFGCDSTISKVVKIKPTPAPVISGPDSTCSNKAYTYSIIAIAGSTYNWTVVGGAISGSSTNNTVKVLWGATGTGTVTVKQTSDFGCDSTISKTVKIVPTPAPVISGPSSTCSNKAYTYSIAAVAGSTYKWTVLGGAISGSSTNNTVKVLWGASGTGTVTVKQTSSFGCDSSISASITIMPTPAPVISGPDSSCSNRAHTYSITVIAGSTYSWSVTGGAISGSSSSNIVRVLWGAAGTGKLTVKQTSSFGCDSTISKNITIVPTPNPVISGPDSTCSNRNSTYSVAGVLGDSYQWTIVGGVVSGPTNSSSISVLWGSAGVGTVSVRQISGVGCDSAVSKTVRIMPTPAPVISGPDTTCSNKAYVYSISAIAGSTYNWVVTGGAISGSSSGNSITVLWGAMGAGTVSVKQTSSFGCDSSASMKVQIMPTPTPILSGPDSTCSSRNSIYSILAVPGHTYKWSVVGGTISGSSTSNSVMILWGAAGIGMVKVVETSAYGCDSSASKSVIKIMQTPKPVVTGPDSVCSNRVAVYSVNGTIGSSCIWSVTGGIISGPTNTNSITVLWGAAGIGTVTAHQTNSFGCDSSTTTNIHIMPTPPVVITGPDSTCSNRSYTYSIASIAGSTYSWTVVGGTISGSRTNNSIKVLWGVAGTGSVTVKQTSAFGCDSTASKTIHIMPTPAPVISGPVTTCSNRTYVYSIKTITGSTYSWTVTGGAISGSSSDSSIKVLWGAAGTGIVNVRQTSSFGCDSSVSKTINITPTPAPVISGPDSTCSNRAYTYSISVIAGSTYNWTVSGGAISGSGSGNVITVLWGAAGAGKITVTQTSSNGCDSTMIKAVQIMPTPKPVITGPDSTCSNRNSIYAITAVPGHTYQWTVTGGSISGTSTSNSVAILWGAAGTGMVKVVETSAFGCDSFASKGVVKIMQTPKPVITGPDSVCSNRVTSYSTNTIIGNSYKWIAVGGTIIGPDNSNSIKVLWGAAGAGSVFVDEISAFGCDSSAIKAIKIKPTPTPVISGSDSACSNRTYTYSVTAIAGSSYSWSVTGGYISGSSAGNTISVLWGPSGTGSVTIKQTSSFGCDSTVSTTIHIMPTPAPVISGPNKACSDRKYNYSISVIPGSTYKWTANGGSILGSDTSNSIVVLWGDSGMGNVIVKQTSKFGCDSSMGKAVQIMPTPAPVISGADSACSNRFYIYTITAIPGSTYNWSVTGGAISGPSNGNSIKVLWGASGAGSVSVVQTSGFGCDSSADKEVKIMPTPAPVISGPSKTCSDRLYSYSVVANLGHSYMWTVTGGVIKGSNKDTAIRVLWGSAGAGQVQVTQTSTFGCDSIVSLNIQIMPTPAPVISGPDSTCSNRTYTYSITAIPGSTYNWTVAGGAISGSASGNSVNVLWGAAGIGTVSVNQTSSFGCDSSASMKVQIMPTPAPVITGPDSTCSNRYYTYSVASVSGTSYLWTVVGGTIAGSNNANFINVLWNTAGIGSVQITQTSAFGCDSMVKKNVHVIATPAPIISGPGTTCQDKVYTYSVTAVNGNTYKWVVSGGVIITGSISSNSVVIKWNTPGNGIVTVTQTGTLGCDSSISRTIQVMPTPAPIITGPLSACQSRTVIYSVAAVGGSTYSWTVTGGAIVGSSSANNVQVKWTQVGTGTVKVTQTSSSGCDSTVSLNVKLIAIPVPVINGQFGGCEKSVFDYTSANKATGYLWKVSGGNIVGPNNNQTVRVSWDTAGMGWIQLTLFNSIGCDSTINKPVNITALSSLKINGPDKVCENHEDYFQTSQVPGMNYNWHITGGGKFKTDSTSYMTQVGWLNSGKYKIKLSYIDKNGCAGNDQKDIVIYEFPKPQIKGNKHSCTNIQYQTYVYTLIDSMGDSLKYVWSVPAAKKVTKLSKASIAVNWGRSGTHTISLKQINTITGCDDSAIFLVNVDSFNTPKITGNSLSGCSPLKVSLRDSTAVSGLTYNWYFDNGDKSTLPVVPKTFTKIGKSTVKLVVSNASGCKDSTVSDITVYPTPKADFTILNTKTIYTEDTVDFKNLSTGAIKYKWDLGESTIVYTTDARKNYANPGEYPVWLWAYNSYGCVDSTEKVVSVKVQPVIFVPDAFTPNHDGLNDHFSVVTRNIVDLNVIIYNRWGEILYKSSLIDFKWDGVYMGKEVPIGVYPYLIQAVGYYGEIIELSGVVQVVK